MTTLEQVGFAEQKKQMVQDINEMIEAYLPEETGADKILREAMNYSVLAGGKRLRPMLMHLSCCLFGGDSRKAAPFMAAMEMIHTHSLVHDDLPAIDNDVLRRGKKTTHAAYGEAIGILAGDALLNYAYECVARAMKEHPDARSVEAFRILAEKTGIQGMLGGQSVDVMMEGKPLDEETLLFIYRKKTSALIEASLMIGAVLAGADEEAVKKMEEIGTSIGLAFQIQDDVLDVEGNQEEIGKPLHSDEKNEKTTYVTLYGLEKAKKEVARLTDLALTQLEQLHREDTILRQLLLSLVGRSS